MQIGGINQGNPVALPVNRAPVARPEPVATQPAAAPVREVEALTSAAPAGVDPALWSVLTTEERAYFARVRSLGPITYGPAAGAGKPALRGGRIDVTV